MMSPALTQLYVKRELRYLNSADIDSVDNRTNRQCHFIPQAFGTLMIVAGSRLSQFIICGLASPILHHNVGSP